MPLRGTVESYELRALGQKRLKALDGDRSSYIPHWQELSDNVEPRGGQWLHRSRARRGKKMHDKIINEEAVFSLGVSAAGMQSGLSSPSRPWFRITTMDPELSERTHIKRFLSRSLSRLFGLMHRSNVYDVFHLGHYSLLLWGTNNEGMARDVQSFARWRHLPIGSYWIASNESGRVDVIYESLPLTISQMMERYGDAVCLDVKTKFARGETEEKRDVIQAVEPNDDRFKGGEIAFNKPYRSFHFDTKAPEDELLRVSGFSALPAHCSRWSVRGDEVWGDSPGMVALGSTKQLQLNEIDIASAIAKGADPPTAVPKDFMAKRMHEGGLRQGELVPFNEMAASAGSRAYSLYDGAAIIPAIEKNGYRIENRIRRAFFADVFMMISNIDDPGRTATEIALKREEKLQVLGPVVDRQHNERFSPQISQLFSWMLSAGYIDDIPEELMDNPVLKIEYTSVMAQAMKALGIDNMDRVLNITGAAAQLDPNARHRLDIPEFVERYADRLGIDPEVVRSDEEVDELINQDRKMSQAQQSAEMAKTGAEAARAASQAPLGTDENALDVALRSVGVGQ